MEFLDNQKQDLLQGVNPRDKDSNHFIMAQLKTLDTMKNIPTVIALNIEQELKIEEDSIKHNINLKG